MATAYQSQQATIERSGTIVSREVQVADGQGGGYISAGVVLPPGVVVLDAWIKVRTVGTGAGTFMLALWNAGITLTLPVNNNVANDFAKPNPAIDGENLPETGTEARELHILCIPTITTGALLEIGVQAYRKEYGS
jgi:hypothetical protein